MKWQPIETAPKDGYDVLLYDTRSSSAVVAGYDDVETTGFVWKTLEGLGYHTESWTHWMLLPEPPK